MSRECQVCTYDNALDATNCEICNTFLSGGNPKTEESEHEEVDLFGNWQQKQYKYEEQQMEYEDDNNPIDEHTESEAISIPNNIRFIDSFKIPIDTQLLVDGYLRQQFIQNVPLSMDIMNLCASFLEESYIWRVNGQSLKHFLNRKKGYRILTSDTFLYNVRENNDINYNLKLECCLFSPKIDHISSFYDEGVGYCFRILEIPKYLQDFDFQIEYQLYCKETNTFFEYTTSISYSNWNKKGHGWNRSESSFILKKQKCISFNELTFICQILSVKRQLPDVNNNYWDQFNRNKNTDHYSLDYEYFKMKMINK